MESGKVALTVSDRYAQGSSLSTCEKCRRLYCYGSTVSERTLGRWERDHCGSLHHGRPDREEGPQCRCGTHSAKRERAESEGCGVSTESARAQSFCYKLPVLCASSQRLKSISLAHPPSLVHAVPNGTESASALNDGLQLQVFPPLWSGRAHCPVRGYHPGHGVRRCGDWQGTGTICGTGYWDFHILCTLPFPLASLSLHALFQALRRHRCRLLRQRLDFFAPSHTLSFLASGFSTGPQSEHVSSSDHIQMWITRCKCIRRMLAVRCLCCDVQAHDLQGSCQTEQRLEQFGSGSRRTVRVQLLPWSCILKVPSQFPGLNKTLF